MATDPAELLGLHLDSLTEVSDLDFTFENVDIGRAYALANTDGVSLLLIEEIVQSVQLYGPNRDELFDPFSGYLPLSLEFSMGRGQVRSLLGEPEERGERRSGTLLGEMPAWDRYACDVNLHIEYELSELSIGLITLTRREET